MLENADLPALIRAARDALGISQEEAARRVGVSTRSYAAWELGESKPRIQNLAAIAGGLNVPATSVLAAAGHGAPPVGVEAREAGAAAAAAAQRADDLSEQVMKLEDEIARLRAQVRASSSPEVVATRTVSTSPDDHYEIGTLVMPLADGRYMTFEGVITGPPGAVKRALSSGAPIGPAGVVGAPPDPRVAGVSEDVAAAATAGPRPRGAHVRTTRDRAGS